MKALIWIVCILIPSTISTILRMNNYTLGGLPTVILYSPVFFVAPYLCHKWDNHKKEKDTHKEKQKKASNETHNTAPIVPEKNEIHQIETHVAETHDVEAAFIDRFVKANAMQNSPNIATSKKGYTQMQILQNENPDLFKKLRSTMVSMSPVTESNANNDNALREGIADSIPQDGKVENSELSIKSEPHADKSKEFCCVFCGAILSADSEYCHECGKVVENFEYVNGLLYLDTLYSVDDKYIGRYVQLIGDYGH